METLTRKNEKAARGVRLTRKAKPEEQSYEQTFSHFEWMSNLIINEAKATRIARQAFDEAIAQLERGSCHG